MEKFKQFFNKYLKNNICLCIILAFVLNFAIEAMARQSLLGGADYLMQTPVVFFYNTLIIFSTLSISLLIKRRIFTYFIISGLWLALGIVNGVILSNRMTPFTTKDLEILDDKDGDRRHFFRKPCVCVQRLRSAVLFYKYLAQHRSRKTERILGGNDARHI